MARARFVKKARKDHKTDDGTIIPKGSSYFWWKFNFSPMVHKSLTNPPASRLTQSAFLSQVYSIQEGIGWMDTDAIEDDRDELVQEIDQLLEETQESLYNMPEHLQETSSSGELLTERIEMLEQWKDDLDAVDFSERPDRGDFDDDEEFEEAELEWHQQVVDELEDADYQGS